MELIGYADVIYQDKMYANVEVLKVKRPTLSKTYYTLRGIDGVPPHKIRLYLRRKMAHSFDDVIKPLFEGKAVYLKGLDKRAGGEFDQRFKFYNDIVPYYLGTDAYYKGDLKFFDGK